MTGNHNSRHRNRSKTTPVPCNSSSSHPPSPSDTYVSVGADAYYRMIDRIATQHAPFDGEPFSFLSSFLLDRPADASCSSTFLWGEFCFFETSKMMEQHRVADAFLFRYRQYHTIWYACRRKVGGYILGFSLSFASDSRMATRQTSC